MFCETSYIYGFKQFLFMNRIKEVLEQKGIKQVWLADQLGKSYNMVNSYVQNRRQPSLDILNQIAVILDLDVKELIVSNKEKQLEEYK
ncbi:Helix-turn-helix [Sphingobacterium mizutaii]|uniref:Helix-turn-helix n=2 Tax=Sphingobacterium mizutaii TaxID=1010 RepID=A0AAJ5BYK6_9SPHI|nr:Helix-turn-helix [Sphingobacterium mizutaii]SNV38081.1 Helix-turn-helix [Sphingobacterium mizutaii]